MPKKHTLKHTLGAIRMAETITGGYRDDILRKYITGDGKKTVKGIADMIDRATGAPELLAALKLCADEIEESLENEGRLGSFATALEKARIAIANTERGGT